VCNEICMEDKVCAREMGFMLVTIAFSWASKCVESILIECNIKFHILCCGFSS